MQTLLGLIPGADSKTVARVEQYRDVRTTVKSVEITVEKAEMIKVERPTMISRKHGHDGQVDPNSKKGFTRLHS
jgi:hypothetical protein